MDNIFKPLDCDDDVVLLNQDTFKVGRLKSLALEGLNMKFNKCTYKDQNQPLGESNWSFLSYLSLNNESIKMSEIQFTYFRDCQVLKIGAKGWLKGKLRIQICLFGPGHKLNKVNLDFSSDEPNEPESPLDEIRQSQEYSMVAVAKKEN